MASSTKHPHGLKVAVITVVLISSLSSYLPSKSGKSKTTHLSPNLDLYFGCFLFYFLDLLLSFFFFWIWAAGSEVQSYSESLQQQRKKTVLGSKPPGCVNKCSNCRPCMAALVIPPHQKKGVRDSSSHGDDDNYYLLLWKCRCGDKLFQP